MAKTEATKEQIARIEELQSILKEAADAYYNRDIEIMSNYEYDALYDELLGLEAQTGYVLPDSITQGVGADVEQTALPKVQHETPMLSLDKTKSREELAAWLGDHVGCLSYKLDGSTVVLTYEGGKLVQGVTRGNGRIGEDITAQSRKFAFVPAEIPFEGKLVVRGEALMTYSEFARVNALQDEGAKYKNPRNLASGTMRALDTSLLDERKVEFHPFTLVSAEGRDENSNAGRLDWLATLGFAPVEHFVVKAQDIAAKIEEIAAHLEENDFPTDGLVLFYDDVAYGDSLGSTGHHPRNGIAFKWQDETARSVVREIFWSPSRTGRLNPVAVFDPVELEGTTVERASIHNVTIISDLKLAVGDEVSIYKANAIIPQIAENFTQSLKDVNDILPKACPVCEGEVGLKMDNDSEFLFCLNDECPAKQKGAFTHFVSRDAMNIMGLSEETLGKLMEAGVVASYADILDLPAKRDEVVDVVEGIRDKSFANIAAAVETARETEAQRFLYALGIREIGRSVSRDICRAYANDLEAIIADAAAGNSGKFEEIEGIGQVMACELCRYMGKNEKMVRDLLARVTITDAGVVEQVAQNDFVNGATFVITGDVHVFANRNEFKAFVEANGGKVSGSVSKKTDFLVTNTPDSGTSKNKKAQELGIAIITEDEFCDRAGFEG